MSKQQKIPKLRFPGFWSEWGATILGGIATFSKGKGISKDDISEGGMISCIRYGELYTHYGEVILEVKSKTHLDKNELVFSEKNDVIIPASGESSFDIAKASCVLNAGIALGGDLNIIKTKEDGVFLSYYLNNRKKLDIASLAQGGSVVHLYSSQLKTLKLHLPTLPEQQKIAHFLTSIDEKINQLTRQKALLEQYKKGVMQQIFSRELRFRDADGKAFGEWEVRRLGEVATFSKGAGISKIDIIEDGINECIRYGELYTHYSEVIQQIKSKTNLEKSELVLSQYNDVIIPASGETQMDIAKASCVLKAGVALGGDLNIIRTKLNGVFLAYYLNNAKKHDIARLSQGISVVHLYSSQLAQLELELPTLPEQQKIADFLTALDEKISRVAGQVEAVKGYKKGLLQGMFV